MKYLFLMILLIISSVVHGQIRPLDDISVGMLFGTKRTVGFHMQASNFYFQTKFSTIYNPVEDFNHTHTHNYGYVFRIYEKIEIMNGFGYVSSWNDIEKQKKQDWHYTFGMVFRDEIFKIMIAIDLHHEYTVGILFHFPNNN